MFEKKFNSAGGKRLIAPVGIVLIVLFVLMLLCQTALADEYTFVSTEEFLAHTEWNEGHTYILADDIEMGGKDWTPVDFTGTLEGNGHKISNLTVESEYSDVGLFSSVIDSEIKNLTLSGFEINGFNKVGALAGYSLNSRLINCSAIGVEIKANAENAGGLVGEIGAYDTDDEGGISFSVDSCFTTGSVEASNNFAGGLFGAVHATNAPVTITMCYSTARVSSGGDAGGLIGYVNINDRDDVVISKCYVKDTEIEGSAGGGLIGYAQSLDGSNIELTQSFADNVTVTAPSAGNVGGLVGTFYGGEITDCYANATVSSSFRVAGLVGSLGGLEESIGTINSSYFIGEITGDADKGGIANDYCSTAYVSGCVYPEETGALEDVINMPVSLSTMKKIATYQSGEMLVTRSFSLPEPEPWGREWSIASSPSPGSVWYIEEDVSFPLLYWYYALNEPTTPYDGTFSIEYGTEDNTYTLNYVVLNEQELGLAYGAVELIGLGATGPGWDGAIALPGEVTDNPGSPTSVYEITNANLSGNAGITSLDLSDSGWLVTLDCSGTGITTLDVSSCGQIVALDCSDNTDLTSLDLNPAIDELDCSGTGITTLDVTGYGQLKMLNCSNTDITALDVSGCGQLYTLDCSGNADLTDLTPGARIVIFNCSGTGISSLDLSGGQFFILDCSDNANLKTLIPSGSFTTLDCSNTGITALDVSGCTNLATLDCSGCALESLKMSGGYDLTVNAGTGGEAAVSGFDFAVKSVTITAAADDGYTFEGFEYLPAGEYTQTSPATFTLPAFALTVTAVFQEEEEEPNTYSIDYTGLTNVESSNTDATIDHGESYMTTLTAVTGYTIDLDTISVTMGGDDVTADFVTNNAISIDSVTGDIVITAEAIPETQETRSRGGGSGTGQARVINSTSEIPGLANETVQEPADTPDVPQTQTPSGPDDGQGSESGEGYGDDGGGSDSGISPAIYILAGVGAIIVIGGVAYLLFLKP